MSTVGSVSIIAITVAMGSAVLTAAGAAVTVHKTAVAADSAALAAAEAATGWIHADPCDGVRDAASSDLAFTIPEVVFASTSSEAPEVSRLSG